MELKNWLILPRINNKKSQFFNFGLQTTHLTGIFGLTNSHINVTPNFFFLGSFTYFLNRIFFKLSWSLFIYLLNMNFENLIVKLHVFYVFNMHIKFRFSRVFFIIRLMNFIFMHNSLPQKFKIKIWPYWHSYWSLIFLKFYK